MTRERRTTRRLLVLSGTSLRGTLTLGAILLALLAPPALASDVLRDETCVPSLNVCTGPGACTPSACVPRSCQPAFHCRSETNRSFECAQDTEIEGETCQLVVGGGVRTNTPDTEASATLVFTNGSVDASNLPNTWISPSAEANAHSEDVELGDVAVGLYTTDITTTEEPTHHWSHVGFGVYHGPGLLPGQDLQAGIYLLDSMPEGCYVGSSAPVLLSASCPRADPGELLGPILP